MLNRLILPLVAWTLLVSCAQAFTHGVAVGGGSSPTLVQGATQPAYDNTNSTVSLVLISNINYANITPVSHGNPADNGYAIRGFGQWTGLQYNFFSGCHQVGLLAYHIPTNAEKTSGLDSNIVDVKMRVDEGSWATIPGPTVDNDAGGITDWNATVCDTGLTDGLHKIDAIAEPATGPDVVMLGPGFDKAGQLWQLLKSPAVFVDSGTRGVAGNILTIPNGVSVQNFNSASISAPPPLSYGMSVTAGGAAAGTTIDGDRNTNPTACVAQTGSNCTGGTGGSGTGPWTFHLSGPAQMLDAVVTASSSANTLNITAISAGSVGKSSPYVAGAGITAGTFINGSAQGGCGGCTGNALTGTYQTNNANTVGSETMYLSIPATFNDQTSYYFSTNAHAGIVRPKVFVCESNAGACPGGLSGSDSNAGTVGAPFLTFAKALTVAPTLDTGTTFHPGKWGELICVMSTGSNLTYTGSRTAQPDASLGYLDFQPANSPDCGMATDPGTQMLVQTPIINNRGYYSTHTRWKGLSQIGAPDTASGNDTKYLAIDGVTQVVQPQGQSPGIGTSGWDCRNSTIWMGSDGVCSGAHMAINNTAWYPYQDCFHNVVVIVGNTCQGSGSPGGYLTATYNTASPLSLTSVATNQANLSGYTLAQLLDGSQTITYTVFNASTSDNCLTGTDGLGNFGVGVLTAIGTNTVTIGSTGTLGDAGKCANGTTVYLSAVGAHPDDWQDDGTLPFHNIIVLNNNFNTTLGGGAQGAFMEAQQVDGVYNSNNTYYVSRIGPAGTIDAVNGGNWNVIYSKNTFANSASFIHDRYAPDINTTMIQDKGPNGGSLLPPTTAGGTNIRSLAAPSQPVYTTSSP